MANKKKAKAKAKASTRSKPLVKSPVKSPVKAPGKPAAKAKAKVKSKPKAKTQIKAKAKPKTKVVSKVVLKSKAALKTKPTFPEKPKTISSARAKSSTQKFLAPVQKSAVQKPTPAKKIDYSKAITPLGDRLVVRVASPERVTAGGLFIPDTVSEAVGFLKATVLAVGRGAQNKSGMIKTMDVQIGDSVLFAQHAGMKVKFNSEDLQIIQETDVMGVVPN